MRLVLREQLVARRDSLLRARLTLRLLILRKRTKCFATLSRSVGDLKALCETEHGYDGSYLKICNTWALKRTVTVYSKWKWTLTWRTFDLENTKCGCECYTPTLCITNENAVRYTLTLASNCPSSATRPDTRSAVHLHLGDASLLRL